MLMEASWSRTLWRMKHFMYLALLLLVRVFYTDTGGDCKFVQPFQGQYY